MTDEGDVRIVDEGHPTDIQMQRDMAPPMPPEGLAWVRFPDGKSQLRKDNNEARYTDMIVTNQKKKKKKKGRKRLQPKGPSRPIELEVGDGVDTSVSEFGYEFN